MADRGLNRHAVALALPSWSLVRKRSGRCGRARHGDPGGTVLHHRAWGSPPDAFLGSWILPLTAHSDTLQRFAGGDGTVGIHGRGGASLLDPLGSARSHGCIRLANAAIDWVVHTVGAGQLAGIPVSVQ